MKSRFATLSMVAVLGLVLGACTDAAPAPTETVTETASPVTPPSPSPTSSAQTVGDCTIEPGTDCHGDDLSGATLRDAQLERSNFSRANLSDALLHRANLRYVDFHAASMNGVNLSSAHLENATLTDANLSHANLSYANLEGAAVTNAVFTHAYKCGTIMPDGKTDSSSCPAPSPTPSPVPSKPHVTEFDMQSQVHCVQRGRPQIKVFYATKDAVKIDLTDAISNTKKGTWDPKVTSGTALVSFTCPRAHQDRHVSQTYTLTAIGSDGTESSATATVTSKAAAHRLGESE